MKPLKVLGALAASTLLLAGCGGGTADTATAGRAIAAGLGHF